MKPDDKKTETLVQLNRLKKENKKLSHQVKRLIKAEYDLFNTQLELDAQLKLYQELYETGKRISSMREFPRVFQEMGQFIIENLNFGGYILLKRKSKSFAAIKAGGCCLNKNGGLINRYHLPLSEELLPLLNTQDTFFSTESVINPLLQKYISDHCPLATFVSHFLCPGDMREPEYLLIVGNPADEEYYTKIEQNSGHMVCIGNLISLVETVLNNQLYYQQIREERTILEIKLNTKNEELGKAEKDIKELQEKVDKPS